MTQYKLVSQQGATIGRSSNRKYLVSMQSSYPGSRIIKLTAQSASAASQGSHARKSISGSRTRFVPRRSTAIRTATAPPAIQSTIRIIPSSWIRDVRYDSLTQELHINMNGKWYGPWYIDPQTYLSFVTGKAVPTTTDKRRPARWGKGIGPSLGAAWHKYIKIGGTAPVGLTLQQQLIRKQQLLARIT